MGRTKEHGIGQWPNPSLSSRDFTDPVGCACKVGRMLRMRDLCICTMHRHAPCMGADTHRRDQRDGWKRRLAKSGNTPTSA